MPNLSAHAASHGSVAVFIDWDNFAIGLREEMPERPPDLGPVLRWVRQLGSVAVCRAYGEWRDAAERLAVYSAGVEVVYAPVLPLASAPTRSNGGKSLADTEMAVDCVDFLHLIPEIATLVIVSSDKDLIPILRFAQRRGLRVFVVGSDRTAGALRDQSDDYVTYRTLLEQEGEAVTTPPVRPMEVPPGRFARAPRLTPARSMLATPTIENTESSTTKADTGPSRATLRRRRGRRRRGGGTGTATPAASAAAASAEAASAEVPSPPEAAESEPDPAMVAPPPAAAETITPEEPEPPSADAPAAAPPATDAPRKPEAESAAAAEESRPALTVLPGESLSRLKKSEPPAETPAEDPAPPAAVSEEVAEAPADPPAVEVVAPPAADGAPPSSNGTPAEDDAPVATQSTDTAEAPPEAEKKAKTTTRRRSTRRRSSTRGKTSTAKSKTAKSAKAAKSTASDKKKTEAKPAAEA